MLLVLWGRLWLLVGGAWILTGLVLYHLVVGCADQGEYVAIRLCCVNTSWFRSQWTIVLHVMLLVQLDKALELRNRACEFGGQFVRDGATELLVDLLLLVDLDCFLDRLYLFV